MRCFLVIFLLFGFFLGPVETPCFGVESLLNKIKIKKRSRWVYSSQDESESFKEDRIETLNQKRIFLMDELESLLERKTREHERIELSLRLGRLYLEEYYARMIALHKEHERLLKTNPKAAFNKREALVYLLRAGRVFDEIRRKYPREKRQDEVLYSLAVIKFDKGFISEGMKFFDELLEKFPKSPFVTDAMIQLGDFYFEKNNFGRAESYYVKAITKNIAQSTPYAIYKKAWCAYNTGRVERALHHLKWAIREEDKSQKVTSLRIKTEALRDITLPFAELRKTSEAIAFFSSYGDPHYRFGLENMATLYFEKGYYKEARGLWELLLKEYPESHKNPDIEINIAESFYLKNDGKSAIERLIARYPLYREGSEWAKKNDNDSLLLETQKKFEEVFRKNVLWFHAVAQKTNNKILYSQIKLAYMKYLEFFEKSQSRGEVQFFLAEIYYKDKEYLKAAENYYEVFKSQITPKYGMVALQYSLAALKQEIMKEANSSQFSPKKIKVAGPKEQFKRQSYTDLEDQYIEVSEVYLKNFSQKSNAPDILFERAYLRYSRNDFEKALFEFKDMMQRYPHHPHAVHSAHLILDIQNKLGDYKSMIATIEQFLKTSFLNRKDFHAEVSNILRQAKLQLIAELERDEKYEEAGDSYMKFASSPHGEKSLIEKALFNAAVDYTKAGKLVKALDAGERLVKRTSNVELLESTLLQLANNYESLSNFVKSAIYYEEFSKRYPKNEKAKGASRLSYIYYWGAGNHRKAESLIIDYMKRYPKEKEDSKKDLVQLLESTGQLGRLKDFYLQEQNQGGPVERVNSLMKYSELYARRHGRLPQKELDQAILLVNRYKSVMKSSERGSYLLGQLMFLKTFQKEEPYNSINLKRAGSQIERRMREKMALLKQLESQYTQVSEIGGAEWTLAASYRVSDLYRILAKSVEEVAPPRNLSGKDLDGYRSEIQKNIVGPLKEKALSMAILCLEKSEKYHFDSFWVGRCYTVASMLSPQKYPSVRTPYLPPLQLAVFLPSKGNLEVGNMKNFNYPYFSSRLFERNMDQFQHLENYLLKENMVKSAHSWNIPTPLNYQTIRIDRIATLKEAYESEKRNVEMEKRPTFSYLAYKIYLHPKESLQEIYLAIQNDPTNDALHNLLALNYLEIGNRVTARVIWLSLLARNAKHGGIWNNLGVLSYMEGNESLSIIQFKEALKYDVTKESFTNLGHLSLKYRNGSAAKSYFEKAISHESDDASARVGYLVAQVQRGEFDKVKGEVVGLSQKYDSDPFARLAISYYLVDIEQERELAREILSEYVNQQPLARNTVFNRMLEEVR